MVDSSDSSIHLIVFLTPSSLALQIRQSDSIVVPTSIAAAAKLLETFDQLGYFMYHLTHVAPLSSRSIFQV
jgi:hypothetical protein